VVAPPGTVESEVQQDADAATTTLSSQHCDEHLYMESNEPCSYHTVIPIGNGQAW